jgi:hypothetical protein
MHLSGAELDADRLEGSVHFVSFLLRAWWRITATESRRLGKAGNRRSQGNCSVEVPAQPAPCNRHAHGGDEIPACQLAGGRVECADGTTANRAVRQAETSNTLMPTQCLAETASIRAQRSQTRAAADL